MATSSNNVDDLDKGCDYAFDFECQPCSRLGYNNEAEFFCEDCKQYLCKRCSAYHQVLPVTQKHVLLSVEDKQDRLEDERALVFTTKLVDNEDMWIIGLAMMPNNKIVLALRYSEKLKVYDTSTNQALSELKLPRAPRSVTKISDDTIATTVPDTGKIVLAKTVPKLAKAGELNVKGESFDLSYNADKGLLAVSFECKVEIIDLTGRVICTIGTAGGKIGLKYPSCVSFSADNMFLFVAVSTGTVLKAGIDGTVIATYKDNKLMVPGGIVASNTGEIYVIDTDECSNGCNIHVISPNCKKIKRRNIKLVDMGGSQKLFYCMCLSLDEQNGRLYVATYGGGLAQVELKDLTS